MRNRQNLIDKSKDFGKLRNQKDWTEKLRYENSSFEGKDLKLHKYKSDIIFKINYSVQTAGKGKTFKMPIFKISLNAVNYLGTKIFEIFYETSS